MRHYRYLFLCTGLLMCWDYPAQAKVELPPCAMHFNTPVPGKVLSQEDLAANNACLSSLKTLEEASKIEAQIAENDRRAEGKQAPPPVFNSGFPGGMISSNMSDSSDHLLPDHNKPAHNRNPKVLLVAQDGKGYVANLELEDGSILEVREGAALPNGLGRIQKITLSGVILSSGGQLSLASK